MRYNRTTIQGIEWELFYLLVLVFFAFERLVGNTFADLFMAYLVDAIIVGARGYFMKRNLSRKTLIDEKFMI